MVYTIGMKCKHTPIMVCYAYQYMVMVCTDIDICNVFVYTLICNCHTAQNACTNDQKVLNLKNYVIY